MHEQGTSDGLRLMMGQMKLNLRVTPATIELIKRYEGLRERAARRSDGVWVIGYGHTRYAREGAQVTEKDAEALLLYDLMQISSALEKVIETPLNAHQFDALAAFSFDVGIEEFRNSDVLRWVREGALLQAASAIEAWRPPQDGHDRPSLDEIVRRRAEEKALFLRPVASAGPAQTFAPRLVVPERSPAPEPTAPPVLVVAPSVPPPSPPVVISPPRTEPVAPPVAAVPVQPVVPPLAEVQKPAPAFAEPARPENAPPVVVGEPSTSSGLPQPLRPVPPNVEPAVRRAAPPAPATLLSVVAAPPEPRAASIDVSHYDALLQALEATAPDTAAPAPVQSPLAPPPIIDEVVTAQPVLTEPVSPEAVAIDNVAPEAVAPMAEVTEAVESEAVALQPATLEVIAVQDATSPGSFPESVVHAVNATAAPEPEPEPEPLIPPPVVFVLDALPANDHPAAPTDIAPEMISSRVGAAEPMTLPATAEAVEPRTESPMETVSPVVPLRPQAPPPLKRWTPPPRPPRPDRTVSTVVHEPAPMVSPPTPVLVVQPEAAVEPTVAMTVEHLEAPSVAAPPSEESVTPLSVALVPPPEPSVDHAEPVDAPLEVSTPPTFEHTKEVAPTGAKPKGRSLFRRAPERTPPLPAPDRPREPVTLRLGALPYLLLGLLGVMLFTGALVSMFRQANLANLLAGLAGVAFMAPSAGHFLLALVSGQRTPPSQPV